jgi:uncharacterized RDD family membrane protein YckC
VTTPENPARWAPDPLGRHQYRYWDGAQWTEHVSDDGLVSTDPLIAHPDPSTAGPSPAGTPTTPTTPTGPPGSSNPPGAAATSGVGGTHLGAPLPGSGASAWAQPVGSAWPQPTRAYDPTAVLGRRYGAFCIDAAISLIVFGILFVATATTHTRAEMLQMPGCHLSANDSSQVECDNRAVVTVNDTVYEADLGVFTALSVAFTLVYFALIEALTGASPGKHMTGLRVVTPQGDNPGLGRSLARWALFAIDGPLSLFLCGIITSSVSSGHRRLGDMAANTFVVARADAGRTVAVPPRLAGR